MEKIIKVTDIPEPSSMRWCDGLPVGNGRLGAMVSGMIPVEFMTLNDDTLWYGPKRERERNHSFEHLGKIRELLKQGKVNEANKLCYMAMTSTPKYYGAYQPMGELDIFFNHSDNAKNYERSLNLEQGIATVSYEIDSMKVKRECFVSYPDNVLVMHITADKRELDIHFHMMRRPCDEGTEALEDDILCMGGHCGHEGMYFECMLTAQTDGKLTRIGDFFGVEKASEITILLSAESEFRTVNVRETALNTLKKAKSAGYNALHENHIRDFSEVFNRSSVDFKSESDKQTKDRIADVKNGKSDKGLLELLFAFSKYLMISASRPGSEAMNLQGLWNNSFAPPWDCNYTININTEMNYWIAEAANLSDCHEPLFALIERMVPNGERTAKTMYNCEGFVAHHATDIWGDTAIEGTSFPSSVWPMGGAWLALHMWDHFEYTQDLDFLQSRALPVLSKAAVFYTQYMVKDDDGYYITGPSVSPENVYIMPDGSIGRECMGPEMDCQIVRALFRAVIKAYEMLGIDDEKYRLFKEFIPKIRSTKINKNGGIMEWDKDYTEAEPGHRHISPLFGLYPDSQINVEKTPVLAEACYNTIERRLENLVTDTYMGLTGWSTVWISACYTRLRYYEKACKCLESFIATSLSDTLLHNLPEFQVDGNFGAGAAVLELLLRSDENGITILPAISEISDAGSFHGLRTRGGFTVAADWENGKIKNAVIISEYGGKCRIKASGITGTDTTTWINEDGYITFNTEKGKRYNIYF